MSDNPKPTYEELEERIRLLEREAAKREKVEAALQESRRLLLDTGRMARVGGWEVDAETLEVTWTEETYRIHEVPLGEKPSVEEAIRFFHPDDRERLKTAIQRALEHGEPYDLELRFTTAKGNPLWTHTICRPQVVDGRTVRLTGTFQDVTQRKRAEEDLARIFELSIDMICIADINTATFLKVNPAFTETLGFSEEELLGRPFLDFIHPDDVAPTAEVVETALKKGRKVISFENRYRTRDGRYRWLNWVSHPMPEEGVTFAVARDVTGQKAAEEALRKSEERFSAMFEHMGSGVAIYEAVGEGRDFVFKAFNAAAERITLITREQALGRRLLELFPRMDEAGLLGALRRVWKTGREEHLPPFYYRDAVRKGWRENRIYKLPSGEVVALFDDVTRRMEAQTELQRSHERFLAVLEGIDATIYVSDLNTYEILFMNKYMREAFGADFTGETCWRVFRHGSGPCGHCPNERLVDEQGRPTGAYTWEDRNPVTGRWYINYDRAVPWVDDRLVHLQVATDITRLKEMEDERREYETRIQQMQKMEAIGTLAGGIAHDFNNILGIILGNTELAMMDLPEADPARESLREVRQASLRARDLVKQILTIARRRELKRSPLQMEPIVKESLKMLRSTLPTTVEIREHLEKDLPPILADPAQVQQIVMNLCTNAAQAMEPGGGVLEIRLSLADLNDTLKTATGEIAAGRYLRLDVRDTGPGIAPELAGRILEPYFTTKAVGEGTGLGLAVVHGIVRECGGGIAVDPGEGRGLGIAIYLPASEPGEGPGETGRDQRALLRGTERILLVDDEPSVLRLGRRILERLGYDVTAKGRGSEALEAFQRDPHRFDLVITDMTMPHMTGDRLAREVIAVRPGMPVILCTGYSKQVSREAAVEIGVRAFVMKPLTAGDLAAAVRRVLDEA